jgi:hypothetical protein
VGAAARGVERAVHLVALAFSPWSPPDLMLASPSPGVLDGLESRTAAHEALREHSGGAALSIVWKSVSSGGL